MNIIIGADLVPTKSNENDFINADIKNLVDEGISEILKSADYSIFNLELPLTDTVSPIPKNGPNLIAKSDCINGYKALGVDFVTLANNHILDQGEQGLFSTIQLLNYANIAYAGAGKNPIDAAKPHIFEFNNKKLGVYCCAEHEFSIVTDKSAGANPFDPLESLDHISALKKDCDYVIVLYHGGKEHYRYPSPNLQKICRKIAEKGADLIVCQHSHCIGCEEKYNGSTIVYGQGNFLFDLSESEFWQTSLLISLDEDLNISYIPIKKQGACVCLAKGKEKDEILSAFLARNQEIKQEGFIEENYSEFAKNMITNYLLTFSGIRKSYILKAINKLSDYRLFDYYIKKRFSKNNILAIKNYIECEAHKEALIESINKYNKKGAK